MFFTLFFSLCSYMSIDPLKSCFFLIFSLLSGVVLISYNFYIWFSYFICLLFLSGVFVILVYFSSLSKLNLYTVGFGLLVFFSFFLFYPFFSFYFLNNSLNIFYYDLNWFFLFWLTFWLIFFMNFSSFFVNFSGALRKI